MRNFSPVSEMRKGRKNLGTSSGAKFEKQSKQGETQSYNFRAYHSFVNSYSCITAAKWDACDMENTAGKARRCHAGRHVACAVGKNSSRYEVFIRRKFPACLPRSREPSQPALSYEHIEIFTKDLEVRRDLGNRPRPANRAHMKRP